jgi:hypothetical protein
MSYDVQWHFSPADLRRMRWGFVPRDMNDRWEIVPDGDALHFLRSWTGDHHYSIRLTSAGVDRVQMRHFIRPREGEPCFRNLRDLISSLLIGRKPQ